MVCVGIQGLLHACLRAVGGEGCLAHLCHGQDAEWQKWDVFLFTLEKYLLIWIPPRLEKDFARAFPGSYVIMVLCLAAVQIIPTKALLLLLRLKLKNEEPSYLIDPLCVPCRAGLGAMHSVKRQLDGTWDGCSPLSVLRGLQVKSVLKDACSLKAFFFVSPQFKDAYSKLVSCLSSHPRLLFFTKTQTYVFIHIHTYMCQHFL